MRQQTARSWQPSGLYTLKSALAAVPDGQDWTEALGPVGEALRLWRADLLDALGGAAAVSPQTRALVEVCVRTHLMVESVDAYILSMPSLVNRSAKSIFPVVIERQKLADGLARYLVLLGLERRASALPSLRELLEAAPAEPEPVGEGEGAAAGFTTLYNAAAAAAFRDQEIERRARALGVAPAEEEEP